MKRKLATLMLAGIALSLPVAAQNADEVVARNIAARGLEKLKRVQSMILSGRLIGPGMDSPITVHLKRPNRYRMDMKPGGNMVTEAYDGTSDWQMGQTGPDADPHESSGDALKSIQDQSEFDSPLVDYRAKGHRVELAGKERVNEALCFKLKITLRTGTVMYQYIDPNSFLEIREEIIRTIDGDKTLEIEESVGDYRRVGGILFPHLFDSNLKGSAEHYRLIIEKIDLNDNIDDSFFKMPSARKD